MQCPVLTQRIVLGLRYAVSGTDIAYGAELSARCRAMRGSSLRPSYALSSTDIAYAATPVRAISGTDKAYGAVPTSYHDMR
eukprot:2336101-Rhodomonas_salina.4